MKNPIQLPAGPLMTANGNPNQQELRCNVLFSLEYGRGTTCWRYAHLPNKGSSAHEVLIAEDVPSSAFWSFYFHISNWCVRPESVVDARYLWLVFYSLDQFDNDTIEGKWQFICRHYKK